MSGPKHLISTTYANYRRSAEKRGFDFLITREEFSSLIFSDCYLCGEKPSNTKSGYGSILTYNGIDRVSNRSGYVSGNVAACCWKCNRIKGQHDLGELRDHLKKMMARIA